jgi:sirohydrochlorin ferrochelatase
LTDYVPERMKGVLGKFPGANLRLARWMVDESKPDDRLARALADAARAVITRERLSQPKVVVVDHGSPQRGVAAIRDHLGRQVSGILGAEVLGVGVASMERRPGAEFSFNDPVLAERLRTPPFDTGNVVLALQFLSPGRHAGAGGDIAEICAAAQNERPHLRTWMSATIGTDPRVVSVLVERYREAANELISRSTAGA